MIGMIHLGENRKKMTGRKCMQDVLLELTLLDVTADGMMRIRKVKSDLSL